MIGSCEMPPPDIVVVCDLAPLRRVTRSLVGRSSLSPSAAFATADGASMACSSDATAARLTAAPPAKMTFPAASTLTVTWPPNTSMSRKRWFMFTCVTPSPFVSYTLVKFTSAKSALVTPNFAGVRLEIRTRDVTRIRRGERRRRATRKGAHCNEDR